MIISSTERRGVWLVLALALGVVAGLARCSAPSSSCTIENCRGCCKADGTCGSCLTSTVPEVPMSPMAFYELYTGKMCDLAVRCQRFATRADCLETLRVLYRQPAYQSAELGYGTLDRIEARRCLKSVEEELSCRAFSFQRCYYPRLVTVKARLGEKCRVAEDCPVGVCAGSGCDRTCVENLPVGSFCVSPYECGRDSICVAGKCARSAGPGQACTSGGCDHTSYCSAGVCKLYPTVGQSCGTGSSYYCIDSSCLAGRCTPYIEDGAACTTGADCRHYCNRDLGVCRAEYNGTAGPGQPCSYQNECLDGYQCQGADLAPNYTGRCVRPQPNDVCTSGYSCPRGYRCDGVCVPAIEGGACATNFNCPSGQECISAEPSAKCGQPIAIGQSCSGYDCVDGAFCSSGRCFSVPKEGEGCVNSSDCQINFICSAGKCRANPIGGSCDYGCGAGRACRAGTDGGSSCQPQALDGAPCRYSLECQSAACVASTCVSACL